MQIDRDVEAFAPEAPGQLDVIARSREAARPLHHDDFVQVRVVADDGSGRRLDQIREAGVGVAACQCANDRRREDDVADEAQPDQQDAAGRQGSTVASSMSITGMSSLIG